MRESQTTRNDDIRASDDAEDKLIKDSNVTAPSGGTERRVAVVTGGGRGIGAEIARRLGHDGRHVVVAWGSSHAEADSVAREIVDAGGAASSIHCDVSDPSQITRLFARVDTELGGLDILVANAGVGVELPIAEYPDDVFERAITVNLLGTFRCFRKAATRIRSGGRIVAISSGYTRRLTTGAGPYAATKAGIEQLVRALALELAPRSVTVNSVLPSLIETDGITPEVRQRIQPLIDAIPLGGLGSPADVAAAVAWLTSDDASWVTGQELAVNGGKN